MVVVFLIRALLLLTVVLFQTVQQPLAAAEFLTRLEVHSQLPIPSSLVTPQMVVQALLVKGGVFLI